MKMNLFPNLCMYLGNILWIAVVFLPSRNTTLFYCLLPCVIISNLWFFKGVLTGIKSFLRRKGILSRRERYICSKYRVCPQCKKALWVNGSGTVTSNEITFQRSCVCGLVMNGTVTATGEVIVEFCRAK